MRSRGGVVTLALCAGLACAMPAAAPALTVQVGGLRASTDGKLARLEGPRVARAWQAAGGVVTATSLRDGEGHEYARPAPDFTMTVNEVPTSSAAGWTLASVVPGRAGKSATLTFTYRLLAGPARLVPELVRTFSLFPGSSVVQSRTVLVNHGALALRVGATRLEQVMSPALTTAEVQAYHGGSDWRDDYRVTSTHGGSFDSEGQVARYEDAAGSGFFEVSGRRGGAMSRTGRDADGTAWTGVDWARDAFDFGPLITDPPNYNRLENPVYPLPVRERTLLPGDRLDLGRAWVGVYTGGPQQAGFEFADQFARWVTPHFARTVGLNSFHPWNHGPGLSDQNLRAQVDRAAAMGVESFMLDDQWQGGDGGESGDWRFDASRFPDKDADGIPDFVQYVHAKGLKLGLWMSPAEFNGASKTYAAHRDWVCTPLGQVTALVPDDAGLGAWDFNNAALRAHLTAVIDRLVAAYDVREFKFDFMAWLDCGTRDYLDYEDAFAAWVAEQQQRHPGVAFELDETNDQRLWAFGTAQLGPTWFDNGHLHNGARQPAKLLHDIWTAAPWIAPSLIGTGLLDGTLKAPYSEDQLLATGLLGHITLWTDLTKLSGRQAARARAWFAWYRAHRAQMAGAAYELTAEDPLDGRPWAVFEPFDPVSGAGVVVAVRQAEGPARRAVRLRGLSPRSSYVVRRAPGGRLVGRMTGRALLTTGLDVHLPRPQSAAVFSITPLR